MHVAIVGAGISGIAAAYYLKECGHVPELLEAGPTLGGRAGSLTLDGRTIDVGGKNIGHKYTRFRQFLTSNGSPELEYFGINSSTVRDGRLHTVDSTRKLASLNHLLHLVGPTDFCRLLRLTNVVRKDPKEGLLGGAHFTKLADQYDNQPLAAWFGPRAVEGFLRPLTLRMNGAEPDQYSLGCLGSNLKMLLDRYDQLTHGMSPVLERFAQSTRVVSNTRVTRLLWAGKSVVGLEMQRPGRSEVRRYDAVVLALPASGAATLLNPEPIRTPLLQVRYNPVTLLVANYRRPIFTPQVRALVFDPTSLVSNAGCYGKGDLNTVRYTLSGQAAAPLHERHTAGHLLELAEAQLRRFVAVDASERTGFVHQYYQHGLCAYTPYHHRTITQLHDWERSVSGLTLCGDYVRGASIESCFESAYESVTRLVSRWQTQHRSSRTRPYLLPNHDHGVSARSNSATPVTTKGTIQWTS